MGTCTGTEVSPSLQRSSGSAGDSVAQCGLSHTLFLHGMGQDLPPVSSDV